RLRSLSGFFCFFGLRIDGLHRLGCYRRRWSHRLVNNLPMDASSSPLAPLHLCENADVLRRRSGRIEARTGLRMMPTFPRSPLSAGRRVFPSTAGTLACQTGPSWYVEQLKPAPGMHCSSSGLHPSFAHLVDASIAPLSVGPVGSIIRRHEVEYSTDPRGPRSGPSYAVSVHRHLIVLR